MSADAAGGRVIVELGEHRLRALRLTWHGGRGRVEAATSADGAVALEVLKRLRREGWFGGLRVMLGVRQRETAVLPRPPVEAAELPQAMRWQLADVLTFPPEEAVLDVLTLFDDEPQARRQVMVVAAHRARLVAWLAPIASIRGLVPDCIDIADLAQRNLVEASCGSDRSIACLTEREQAVLFTVSRGRDLLFSRVFELTPGGDGDSDGDGDRLAERIGVQLHRAIDSLERRSPAYAPVRILTGPGRGAAPLEAIAALCGLPAEPLDWRAALDVEATVQADFDADPALIHLAGAALRRAPEMTDA
jgi:MSHA biogenesis protein MshI